MPSEDYARLVEKAGEEYTKNIEARAKKELEDLWESEHAGEVDIEVEKRIREISGSPEMAVGGIEQAYKRGRERIVTEYMRKRMEKEPKTKEQIDAIEKMFKRKRQRDPGERDVNNFMSDVLFRRGRLEKLSDDFNDNDRRAMGGFLRDWGIRADINTTGDITKAEYLKAKKTPDGFFSLIMKTIKRALNPVPKKNKRKAK